MFKCNTSLLGINYDERDVKSYRINISSKWVLLYFVVLVLIWIKETIEINGTGICFQISGY